MNDALQEFARAELKAGLATLPESNHRIFKLMYGRKMDRRGLATRSVEDAEAMPIDAVVDEMEPEKLDWAMQQVQRSIDKLSVTSEA